MTTFGLKESAFEDYFSASTAFVGSKRLASDIAVIKSNYGDVWDELEQKERDQLVDETIMKPEAVLRYQSSEAPQLPFGAGQVFPRLKHPTGQKTNLIDDTSGSQGEDLDSASSSGICTYSYQDEHSAPFSWRTRSQQDLAFEFGRPPSMTSDELNENNLETLSASPSKVLNRNSNLYLARQSRGNPSYSKPVQIPIVPNIPKPEPVPDVTRHSVPPEQINNFVYESSPNRIVLDFGAENDDTDESIRTDSPTAESTKSTRSLISKVKTLTLTRRKKSSDCSDHRKSSTLDFRKKSQESLNLKQRHSLTSSSTLDNSKKIIKSSVAPPPPPPSVRPSVVPPPPPVRTVSQISHKPTTTSSSEGDPKVEVQVQDSGDLEGFKVNLNTETEIPKTGFDFLDNW